MPDRGMRVPESQDHKLPLPRKHEIKSGDRRCYVCLTGRQSTLGFNVVTIETCIPGSLQQQWRLGVAREFQLRLSGLSAEVNLANPDRPLRMALFTDKPHQKFTITPA
jgi:hypothetical protein